MDAFYLVSIVILGGVIVGLIAFAFALKGQIAILWLQVERIDRRHFVACRDEFPEMIPSAVDYTHRHQHLN